MATTLFAANITRKRYFVVSWSKDWYTSKPWVHKGENIPYVAIRKNTSDTGKVAFTYVYVGPFSIVSGKWIA